ncbi:MAG: efflux RND transporter permease subunit, partial [Deltaproteobacteria bacterium]|nr:efflux RND transporter permease subunit [Deltaproteobacteria bacterium]
MNNSGDKLDLSNPNPLDLIIDYRRILISIIAVVSIVFGYFALQLKTDPSLKSGLDTSSKTYEHYKRFVETFGNEEFTLVVIKTRAGILDPQTLDMVDSLTRKLEQVEGVSEVISLTNLRLFQERGGSFGNFPLFERVQGKIKPIEQNSLANLRRSLPMTNLLVSTDFNTIGIAIKVEEKYKYEDIVYDKLVRVVDQDLKGNKLAEEYRIVGPPFIRKAIVDYNIQTGIVFGVLSMLIGAIVSVYVFKSLKVTLVTNFILGICVLWVLGLMVAMNIPLNSTTALAFGFVPITTIEIVIHMVVRYHLYHQITQNKIDALKKSVRWLARPCFMCVATTAVGFGTLMISSIPMVRELGFIMSIGVIVAYGLAIIMTPAFFSVMKTLDNPESSDILVDWLERTLKKIELFISARSRMVVIFSLVLSAFLLAGSPRIHSDAQIFRMLDESTKTVQDIRFVEKNLSPAQTLELFLESDPNAFKQPQMWKKVSELEKRIREIPDVISTDSYESVLTYLSSITMDKPNETRDIYSDPNLIPQLLFMTSLSAGGKRITEKYISENFDKARISILINNSPDKPIGQTISEVQGIADQVMKGAGKATVTGDLVLVSAQTEALIDDQVESMFIAAFLITIIMMIQLRSFVLGLICLIPNIPPVAAVFGLMGWFGISLDMVTVFAATVAIGLAVDNTIHYMTQLKREMSFHPETSIEEHVFRTYRFTARQIASWSVVTLLGFLALSGSPFRPVVFFGILGCSAITLGLFGDLIFLPALILTSKKIRKTITDICEREQKSHISNNVASP